MIVENLGMFLQEGNRSKAYLQKMLKGNLLPNFVLLIQNPDKKREALNTNPENSENIYYNPNLPELDTLNETRISYQVVPARSCNDECVVEILRNRPETYFVFSGSGILKEAFNAEKKFIHVHPGKLPEYRGSTCPYYSSLIEGRWFCTAFIMDLEIDAGELIAIREFALPANEVDPTRCYDPHTRSEVLVDVIRQLAGTGRIETTKQDLSRGTDYYIIHPVLEYIAKESYKVALNGK